MAAVSHIDRRLTTRECSGTVTVSSELDDISESTEALQSVGVQRLYLPRPGDACQSEDAIALLWPPSYQQTVVNVDPQKLPNKKDVTLLVGTVNNINVVSCQSAGLPLVEELIDKFQNHQKPLDNLEVVSDKSDIEKKLSNNVFGIPTKWYYLIVALVTLSGAACILTNVVFSVEKFWPPNEESDSLSSESTLITGKKEEFIIIDKSWWYLLVTLVALSCINLVSTAMFSFKKYINTTESISQSQISSIDTVPREFLSEAPRMISRSFWLAQPPTGELDPNPLPVERVVVCHTATEEAVSLAECCLVIRNIQMSHIEARKWYDIGFSFLIGGDGSIYIGRGWDWVGAHTKGFNIGTLGIAMIGTFTTKLPNNNQLTALRKLLQLGVKMNKIKKNYSLITQCQLQQTMSPERRLAEELNSWPHFESSMPVM